MRERAALVSVCGERGNSDRSAGKVELVSVCWKGGTRLRFDGQERCVLTILPFKIRWMRVCCDGSTEATGWGL